jgi:hypothetical protein
VWQGRRLRFAHRARGSLTPGGGLPGAGPLFGRGAGASDGLTESERVGREPPWDAAGAPRPIPGIAAGTSKVFGAAARPGATPPRRSDATDGWRRAPLAPRNEGLRERGMPLAWQKLLVFLARGLGFAEKQRGGRVLLFAEAGRCITHSCWAWGPVCAAGAAGTVPYGWARKLGENQAGRRAVVEDARTRALESSS